MGESGHRPVEFLPASLNIPPASIRYFVTDTLTRESVPVGGTGLSRLRGKLDWAEERSPDVLDGIEPIESLGLTAKRESTGCFCSSEPIATRSSYVFNKSLNKQIAISDS
ncbi:hypothetical protein K0M31_010880 [Melipona bicolor]|uniref:Uncharacterized protein n=1 Tax=Melipona bicolor TaxID=60889 RepID=A0AA40FLT6_9HYME|nr:hypothetical protein K0M31_010880 [Melipona bicolor]